MECLKYLLMLKNISIFCKICLKFRISNSFETVAGFYLTKSEQEIKSSMNHFLSKPLRANPTKWSNTFKQFALPCGLAHIFIRIL